MIVSLRVFNNSLLHIVRDEHRGSCARSACQQESILAVGPVRRCGQPHALPCAFGGACARLSKWLRETAARSCTFFGDDRAVVLSHVSVHRPGRASTSLALLEPSAEGPTVRSIRCTDGARDLGERPIVACGRWANPRRLAQATRPNDAARRLADMIHSPALFGLCNLQPTTSRSRRTSPVARADRSARQPRSWTITGLPRARAAPRGTTPYAKGATLACRAEPGTLRRPRSTACCTMSGIRT